MNTFMQPPKRHWVKRGKTETLINGGHVGSILGSHGRTFLCLLFVFGCLSLCFGIVDIIEQFALFGVETCNMERIGETFQSSSHLYILN